MVEFDCVDCGIHVYAVSLEEPPEPPRCAMCDFMPFWFNDPEMVKRLDPTREEYFKELRQKQQGNG